METLSNLQRAVLAKLLAGDHPGIGGAAGANGEAQVVSRRYTGSGFFCDFSGRRRSHR
jgi:hypothetical protein